MKELEKTKRISIAAILSILLILVGLLNYRRPSHLYNQNSSSTLEKIQQTDYLVQPSEVDQNVHALVDVRSSYEFEKGHMDGAINVYVPELLSSRNYELLQELTGAGKTLLLYGNDPDETLPAFMMLCQLGVGPVQIMEAKNHFEKDRLKTSYARVEADAPEVKKFIEASVKKAAEKPKVIITKPPAPKKVLPAKKKKKKMPEGGC